MGCQKEIAATIIDQDAGLSRTISPNSTMTWHRYSMWFGRLGFADVCHDSARRLTKAMAESRRVAAGLSQIPTTSPISMTVRDGLDPQVWRWSSRSDLLTQKRSIKSATTYRACPAVPSPYSRHPWTWGIENSGQWILDVAFGEDDCRVRTGNADENFSTLRRMALNMLKRESTSKGGIAARRKGAVRDEGYMSTVLYA